MLQVIIIIIILFVILILFYVNSVPQKQQKYELSEFDMDIVNSYEKIFGETKYSISPFSKYSPEINNHETIILLQKQINLNNKLKKLE